MKIYTIKSKHSWLATATMLVGLVAGCPAPEAPGPASTSSTSSTSTTTGTTGDTGIEDDPADFVAASPEERLLAIEGGLGLRAAQAFAAMLQAELDSEESGNTCPTRTADGEIVRVSASTCNVDEIQYDGEVVARNAITLRDLVEAPTFDSSRPMSVDFDGFHVSRGGAIKTIDGRVEQSSPDAPAFTSRSVLTMGGDMPEMSEDLSLSCETDGASRICDVVAGSAEIAGLGSYAIRGKVEVGSTRYYGWIELEGKQTLALDLDTMDDKGCHPYAIDGAPAGEVCVSTDVPPPIELELGYGAGCIDGQLMLEGYVDVEVDAMTIEVLGPRMRAGLGTELANPHSTLDGWVWTAAADLGAAEWSCEELPETSFRVIAELDGQRACDVWGANGSAFPDQCAEW